MSRALPVRSPKSIADEVRKEIQGTRAIVGVDMVNGRPTVQLSKEFLNELLIAAATKGVETATAHHASVDAARRTPNTRLRRGFFRLWVALCILWLAFIMVIIFKNRDEGSFYWGAFGLFAVGVPIAIPVVAIATTRLGLWVWSGFRGDP